MSVASSAQAAGSNVAQRAPSLTQIPRTARIVPWTVPFAAGLAMVVAVFWAIIATPGDLQQRDLYPSLELDRVIEHSVYPLWSPRGTLNIAGTGRLPITLLLVGFAKLVGLEGATYARLIVLWIAGLGYVSTFASFALISRWRPTVPKTAAAIGAMVTAVSFVVNPWTIARLEHSWLLAQWAAAPLVLGLYIEGTRTGRRRWIIGSALTFALLGAAQPHYLVFTALSLAAWIVGTWAIRRETRRRTLADAALWSMALAPLLAYQIAPFAALKLFGGSPDPAYTLMDQTRTTISKYQDLPTTLQGIANFNWHQRLRLPDASRLPWEFAGWVAALLPLVAAIRLRWGAPARFLALVGYAAALVAAASAWEPTADAYQAAVNTVPGLWIFREPDRAVGLFVMAQAFGAGFVVADLISRLRRCRQLWRAIAPALLAAYVGLALGVHAAPAIPLLWDEHRPGYVPRELPGDYREALQAADADAGTDGRILVVSSDDRTPPWDDTRILRLMEAASLASPSLTGDTRSPVPPAPVAGRWMEFLLGIDPAEALNAVRRAGFSHVIVMRDQADGDELARDFLASRAVDVLASGPNALALRVREPAPLVQALDAAWTDRLDIPAPDGSAHLLANHRQAPTLPEQFAGAGTTRDAVFATDRAVVLRPVTPWFGFHGTRSGWTRGSAYADERQAWLKHLERTGLQDWAADYNLGLAFAISGGERQPLHLDLSDAPGRDVWIRTFSSPQSTWIEAAIGQDAIRRTTSSASTAWVWHLVGEARSTTLSIRAGPGLEAVSTVALTPKGWRPRRSATVTPLQQPALTVSERQRTRIEAAAHTAEGLAFVVLREAYDPVWFAWVDGQAHAPMLADGLWNGYVVPVTEGSELTFEYAPQRWYDLGIVISALSASALFVALVVVGTPVGRAVGSIRHASRRLPKR